MFKQDQNEQMKDKDARPRMQGSHVLQSKSSPSILLRILIRDKSWEVNGIGREKVKLDSRLWKDMTNITNKALFSSFIHLFIYSENTYWGHLCTIHCPRSWAHWWGIDSLMETAEKWTDNYLNQCGKADAHRLWVAILKGTANIHREYGLRKGSTEEMTHELKLKK